MTITKYSKKRSALAGVLCASGVLSVGGGGLAAGWAIWHKKPAQDGSSSNSNVYIWATIDGPLFLDDINIPKTITVNIPRGTGDRLKTPHDTIDYTFKGNTWLVSLDGSKATIEVYPVTNASTGKHYFTIEMNESAFTCQVIIVIYAKGALPAITATVSNPIIRGDTNTNSTIKVTGWHGVDLTTLQMPNPNLNLEIISEQWNITSDYATISVSSSSTCGEDVFFINLELETTNGLSCSVIIPVEDARLYLIDPFTIWQIPPIPAIPYDGSDVVYNGAHVGDAQLGGNSGIRDSHGNMIVADFVQYTSITIDTTKSYKMVVSDCVMSGGVQKSVVFKITQGTQFRAVEPYEDAGYFNYYLDFVLSYQTPFASDDGANTIISQGGDNYINNFDCLYIDGTEVNEIKCNIVADGVTYNNVILADQTHGGIFVS